MHIVILIKKLLEVCRQITVMITLALLVLALFPQHDHQTTSLEGRLCLAVLSRKETCGKWMGTISDTIGHGTGMGKLRH